jgi:hypothetical protein
MIIKAIVRTEFIEKISKGTAGAGNGQSNAETPSKIYRYSISPSNQPACPQSSRTSTDAAPFLAAKHIVNHMLFTELNGVGGTCP